jgi:hypothetical protein
MGWLALGAVLLGVSEKWPLYLPLALRSTKVLVKSRHRVGTWASMDLFLAIGAGDE